ncbi:MAG TPA: hypothetical protein VHW44_13185 [Pseudonocardiaceae bacterium]|nr:hypothetical protein [Pseudonocardiaceae bacterium]
MDPDQTAGWVELGGPLEVSGVRMTRSPGRGAQSTARFLGACQRPVPGGFWYDVIMSSRPGADLTRVLILTAGVLCSIGLFIAGLAFVFTGIEEQHVGDTSYVITFGHPGTDCDNPEAVLVDVDNGQPLFCAAEVSGVGSPINQTVLVPGFTRAQDDEITQLAGSLGANGLSVAAQHQIQDRVNQIAATVPPADRPGHGAFLWGTRRAWIGGSMILVGILGFYWIIRTANRR